jgi:hypothetical protein
LLWRHTKKLGRVGDAFRISPIAFIDRDVIPVVTDL